MRLPQSITRSLSVRFLRFPAIAAVSAILILASVGAGASTSQLTYGPANLRFGGTTVGQTETLLLTLTNNGQASVTISEVMVSNPEFATSAISLPLVLSAGESVALNVGFAPTVTGWTQGTIKFTSNASNSTLVVDMEGTGVTSEAVTASPSAVSFGEIAIGATSTLPVVLTNTRTWKVTLSSVQSVGSEFSVSGATFPLTLSAGQSVTLNASFSPQSAGLAGGSVFVVSPGLVIPLTGTGASAVGQLTAAPAPLSFGDVPVGTTAVLPITLNASGASVTVSSASSSSSQFVLDGASFPLTIGAGQSQSFNVSFTPKGSGTVSGSFTFVSNASDSQDVESLSGIGTVTPYSVNLYWNSTPDVAGYNVYRSTSTNGTYTKINSALDPNAAYTDGSVVSGQTYYYEATTVSVSGQESARSTPPVEAVVP